MDPVAETAAAIGMHFGTLEARQRAMGRTEGAASLYRVAVDAAEVFQQRLAEEIAWGDEADLTQTLHNYAARILEYMANEGVVPSKDHLATLAHESIYYFMEPKFGAPLTDTERNQILGLLVSGIEGGINYWAQIVDTEYPSGTKARDFAEGGKMQPKGDYYHWAELVPMTPGGAVIIRDTEASPDSAEHQMQEFLVRATKAKRGLKRYFTGEEPEGEESEWPEYTPKERAEWVLYKLNLPAIQKAWSKLKFEYPQVYKRTVDEDYDANDGDLFIQLALLGEHTYG